MFTGDQKETVTVPVQGMEPGDHGFAAYDADREHWDIASAFVGTGLARGEKVVFIGPQDLHADEVLSRLERGSPLVDAAFRCGRLAVTSMSAMMSPLRAFSATRQAELIHAEADLAVRQGYRGLRSLIDMRWTYDLRPDLDAVLHREAHAEHLFTGRPYSELCAYDRGSFSPGLLDAARRAHPRAMIDRLGALHVAHDHGAVRLAGDADLASRAQLVAALTESLARTGGTVTVDLTDLHFLAARCATDLLRGAAAAPGDDRITVRCRPLHAALLRRLGARSVRHLTLIEVNRAC